MSRRQVFRALALYVAIGWGFTEIVQGVVSQVGGPPAIATFTTIVFIVGFPIVLFLAWVFDINRQGMRFEPSGRKGPLLVTLAVAVLFSASYGIYRYLPRDSEALDYEKPDQIVVAVLPFRNLSADDSMDYLGNAMGEDLLTAISVIPGLHVKASFSSYALAGEQPGVFEEKLGANRLLDGTFKAQGDNLRVNARLVDTSSGDVLWSRVLTDSLDNIYQLQDQIARDLASELGMLHPSSARSTSRQVDPEVYRLYLQARAGMVNPWMDTQNTISKIQQILEIEPNFPEALYFLGFLNTGKAWVIEDRQSPWLKIGEEYTLRALEIDPDLPEAYATLALNYALQYRWNEARFTADRALEVAGSRPLNVLYTFAYNNLGHVGRTREILERAYEADPLNPMIIRDLITLNAQQGNQVRALQWEEVAQQLGIRYQRHYLTQVYASQGDWESARELAALWGEEHGFPLEMGEYILEAWTSGRSESFERATDEMVAAGQLPLGQAIWNYVASGAPAGKVFRLVREAIPLGQFNQISLIDPLAARYRQDSRFVEIFSELSLVEYWRNLELPTFCETESIAGLCE